LLALSNSQRWAGVAFLLPHKVGPFKVRPSLLSQREKIKTQTIKLTMIGYLQKIMNTFYIKQEI